MYSDPVFDQIDGENVYGLMSQVITTPVAYLTSIDFIDPFQATDNANPIDEQQFTYQDIKAYIDEYGGTFWEAAADFYGSWRMCSVGPDKSYAHPPDGPYFYGSGSLCYDATNGTTSYGNIWRSQKHPDSVQPPVGDLIGDH
jgi:hypothetical protein